MRYNSTRVSETYELVERKQSLWCPYGREKETWHPFKSKYQMQNVHALKIRVQTVVRNMTINAIVCIGRGGQCEGQDGVVR